MKNGRIRGYEKYTYRYYPIIDKAEKQLEIMTGLFIKGRLSKEEIDIYQRMSALIALAKSATTSEECGECVKELTDLKIKFIYIDKKRKSIG